MQKNILATLNLIFFKEGKEVSIQTKVEVLIELSIKQLYSFQSFTSINLKIKISSILFKFVDIKTKIY